MKSLLFAIALLIASPVVAEEPPAATAPTVETLGVASLITQAEADRLWAYSHGESDAAREAAFKATNAAAGDNTRPEVIAAWQRVQALDEAVRAPVERLIRNGYWLKTEGRNREFDEAVWLALQHLFDLELVDMTLQQLPPLVKAGLVKGDAYAMMYDRYESTMGRPQKYGSQFQCRDGKAVPNPMVDAARVDEFRRDAGMASSFAENQARIQGYCEM